MRKMLLVVAVLIAACLPEIGTELVDAFDTAAEGLIVAKVTCSGGSSLAPLDGQTNQQESCSAFNPDSTRISFDGENLIPRWVSRTPSIVTIDVVGNIRAEGPAGSSWIVAFGTYESSDSLQVFSQ